MLFIAVATTADFPFAGRFGPAGAFAWTRNDTNKQGRLNPLDNGSMT